MPEVLAGVPPPEIELPNVLVELAGKHPVTPVWRNQVGGLTVLIEDPAGHRFVKWLPPGCGLDLHAEIERLRWASRYTSVPSVRRHDEDARGAWFESDAITGTNALAPGWTTQPEPAVIALGRGLRWLHERLPLAECPFEWSAQERVADAHRRENDGHLEPARWHPEHADLTVEQALTAVGEPPPVDRLVVCHGDACAPNTLLDRHGRVTGHVDLGALGVADRWADLAVATWSTVWNYGPGWEQGLLDAYGIEPDPKRTAYYRLLWDLGP